MSIKVMPHVGVDWQFWVVGLQIADYPARLYLNLGPLYLLLEFAVSGPKEAK